MDLAVIVPPLPGGVWGFIGAFVCLAVALTLLLVAVCGPLFGSMTEAFFLKTGKVFYEKCALQLTRFAVLVGLAAGLILIAAGWLALRRWFPELLEPPFGMRLIFFVLVPGMGYGLFLVRALTWKGLNHLPRTRFILGLLPAALGLAFMIRLSLPLEKIRAFIDNPGSASAGGALLEALSPGGNIGSALAWHVGFALCTGLAATAIFGAWYLFLRRNREDYGRDYYVFALRHCALWGAGLIVPTTVCAGRLAFLLSPGDPATAFSWADPTVLRFACTVVFSLLAFILLLVIGKSALPMRRKITAVFAGVFFLISFFGQLALFHLTVTLPPPGV